MKQPDALLEALDAYEKSHKRFMEAAREYIEICIKTLEPTETTKEDPKPDTEKKAEPQGDKKEVRKYTKTDIRELLANKASEDDGRFKIAVKELVKKYANGGTLTDIPEDKYPELAQELEGIGHE